ncbi:MAG: hypothetical protein Q7S38_00335 [bacterium]|nr:hypothetical protein [bacterium]
MSESKDNSSPIDRVFDSIGRKLGFEKSPDEKAIYQYPKQDEPVLWIDLLTREKPFKAWYYSIDLSKDPESIRIIPESNTRSVIHFFPQEAEETYKRQTEENPWLDDPVFRNKRISITKQNITAFIDLLNTIKNGELEGTEYIIGETNYIMANFALGIGFKRCWQEGFNPPDLTMPMDDEDHEYKIGVSVAELFEIYDLKNQAPTKGSVLKKIKENKAKNKKQLAVSLSC